MSEDQRDDGTVPNEDSPRLPLDRRRFVSVTGAALAGAASGLVGTAAAGTRSEFTFRNEVNAVDDLGMDPDGGSSIDDALANAASDGTLIIFPDGKYKLGSVSLSGLRNFGMVAADGANPTFVATGSWRDWVSFPSCRNILLEGFDFDMQGGENGGTINMQMDGDWVLRNIRKLGHHPDSSAGFRLGVNSGGAKGLAERVEARDGARDGTGAVGIFVPPAHAGEVVIRDSVVANFSNNGIYGSAPGHGSGGAVKVEGGLYKNNHVAGVRLGSEGSYARRVTVVNDAVAPTIGSDSPNQRGFYLRQGGDGIVIDGCDVVHEYEGAGQPVTIGGAASGNNCGVTDTRIKNNSGSRAIYLNSGVADGWDGSGVHLSGSGNLAAPSGWVECKNGGCEAPTKVSIEVDGSGSKSKSRSRSRRKSTDATGDLPNTLVVDGSNVDETTYTFTVSEAVERSGSLGSLDDADSVSGTTATGSVNGGVDGYRFAGEITDLTVDGSARLIVDGEEVDPSEYGDTPGLTNTLVVDDTDAGNGSTYSFSVSGNVRRSGELGTLDDADSITGSAASGAVWGGVDGYYYSGEITDLTVDGDATLLVDGEAVDPARYGDGTQLPNTLVIDAKETRGEASYEFTVSEAVERSGELGTLDDADSVSGTTATGSVWRGVDGYRFAGEITDLTVDGNADVYLNGEQVDPGQLGTATQLPNRVILDARDVDAEASYAIEVSGELEPSTEFPPESDDSIERSAVTGSVHDAVDAYRYSGDIVAFDLDGAALVVVEDNDD